jgi:hypothetical protein
MASATRWLPVGSARIVRGAGSAGGWARAEAAHGWAIQSPTPRENRERKRRVTATSS